MKSLYIKPLRGTLDPFHIRIALNRMALPLD